MDNFDPRTKKFTPGPWQLRLGAQPYIVAPNRMVMRQDKMEPFLVVQVGSFYYPADTTDEVFANAQLISAAPNLLHICEWLLAEAEDGRAVVRSRLVDAAQKAVNKVYGVRSQMWVAEWQGG